jgi:hypothetical protein
VTPQPAMTQDEVLAAMKRGALVLRECSPVEDESPAAARLDQALAAVAALYEERDALRALSKRWRQIGAEHGPRIFTGNDHLLFANELDAALPPLPEGERK